MPTTSISVPTVPTVNVGIDTSSTHLDGHALPVNKTFRVTNTPAGHRKLIEDLLPLAVLPSDIRVVIESTGGLELPVALALEQAGIQIAIVKPERVRYFAKAHGQLAKTDAIDARMLAMFCRDVKVPIIPLPPEELRHFRDLLDRRGQLVEMRTMESNRRASTHFEKALESLEKHMAWIDSEIKDIEIELDRRIAANEQWSEIDRILQSTPAIGPQTSRMLIGYLPELGKVDRKAIGQLVGVAPIANDSGTTEGARHIVGGRKQVRTALYMAAVASLRWNEVCKALYKRLTKSGKKPKSALIAVAHKLLTIVNAMVAKKTLWRDSNLAVSS